MKATRVLHLITSTRIGGAERQLITLLRALTTPAFQHYLGVMQAGSGLETELEGLPISIHNFGFRQRRTIPTLNRMRRFYQEFQIDLVHAHLHLASLCGRWALPLVKRPAFVVTEHQDLWKRGGVTLLQERLLRRVTDMKIAVSEPQREASIAHEGYREDRVVCIPNSIDASQFRNARRFRDEVRNELGIPSGVLVVGNVANHIEQKRLELLLESFSKIPVRGVEPHLLLVGDGPLNSELREQARELGIASRVHFTGARRDVPRMLGAMDVFAISSSWEGMPINLLEAMGAGLPAVSFDVGGISQVVEDGVDGLLVDKGDIEGMAVRLGFLLMDQDLRNRMGRNALSAIELRHDAALNAKRILELYSSILNGSGDLGGQAR